MAVGAGAVSDMGKADWHLPKVRKEGGLLQTHRLEEFEGHNLERFAPGPCTNA